MLRCRPRNGKHNHGHYALGFLAESKGWTNDNGVYNGMFTPIDAIHDFSDTDLQTVKESVSWYAITKDFDFFGSSL